MVTVVVVVAVVVEVIVVAVIAVAVLVATRWFCSWEPDQSLFLELDQASFRRL